MHVINCFKCSKINTILVLTIHFSNDILNFVVDEETRQQIQFEKSCKKN